MTQYFARDSSPGAKCLVFMDSGNQWLIEMTADRLQSDLTDVTDEYGANIGLSMPCVIGMYSSLHSGTGPDLNGRVTLRADKIEAILGVEP